MSSQRWESSNKLERKGADEVAEPRHRVGPKGVSSGVSFRDLPEPCFHQLKKVCLHYTNKCSGKYENNKMAARYVHQLANEVLFLLSGISEEIQIHQDIAKLAEQRLGEWNSNFPESLKAIGNPHEIANLIESQRAEISELRDILQAERANKQRDMSYAMKSMDCQLHASRNGALNERQKLGMEYETLKASMESQLKANEEEKEQTLRQLHEYYSNELKSKSEHYESLLAECNATWTSLLTQKNSEIDNLTLQKDSITSTLAQQRESFKNQLKHMQDKLDNQLDGSSVATDDMSLDDLSAASSTVITESAACSTSASPSGGNSTNNKKGKDLSRKYKKRLRRVMKELSACHDQCDIKDVENAKLVEKLQIALSEVAACNQKMTNMRESIEGFRYHMLKCSLPNCRSSDVFEGREHFEKYEDESKLSYIPKENINVLQHVPHFLHHKVHQSKMSSTKNYIERE